MKKHLTTAFFSLFFLAGLSLLLYPFISNEWNNYRQSRLISTYDEVVSNMEAANEIDYETEWSGAYAYNEALRPYILPDSFAVASATEEDKICIYGMVISMPFLGFQLISSRFFHLLTAVHIVAVPLMIKKMSYTVNKKLIKMVFFLYTVVILSKNINYYIESMIPGRYHIISCPYISIFHKEKTNEVFGEIYINGRFW